MEIERFDGEMINNLKIDYEICNEWIRDSFLLKENAILPEKTPIRLSKDIFITTMPCALPEIGIGGIKIVSRYPNRNPSIDSIILLFRLSDGKVFAEMDSNLITTLRTGAVAALSCKLFSKKNFKTVGIVGLGNTARSSLRCISKLYADRELTINLLKYKNQAEIFIDDFADCKNINFKVYLREEKPYSFIKDSDVLISCITSASGFFAEESVYQKGILLIPVHTRGFENCDTKFDKIFGDDTAHLKHFKFFNEFKSFSEISEVLRNEKDGRSSDEDRIISYSIGIAVHDIFFAWKIYQKLKIDER